MSKTKSSGISTLGLLGVVFVTLKLTNFIDWSWWYVTMPFWGGVALLLTIAAMCGLALLLMHALEYMWDYLRSKLR